MRDRKGSCSYRCAIASFRRSPSASCDLIFSPFLAGNFPFRVNAPLYATPGRQTDAMMETERKDRDGGATEVEKKTYKNSTSLGNDVSRPQLIHNFRKFSLEHRPHNTRDYFKMREDRHERPESEWLARRSFGSRCVLRRGKPFSATLCVSVRKNNENYELIVVVIVP